MPYVQRPVITRDAPGSVWDDWLSTDQRNAASRPDVATFTSPVLTKPIALDGQPLVHLTATTTGTDGDFVVKLIDVYPDEVPEQRELGGYQLMVSSDILRGRYRKSFEHPEAIPAGKPQLYQFRLPVMNTPSAPATALWCRCSQAGSRSMTATRKPMSVPFSRHRQRLTNPQRSPLIPPQAGSQCIRPLRSRLKAHTL